MYKLLDQLELKLKEAEKVRREIGMNLPSNDGYLTTESQQIRSALLNIIDWSKFKIAEEKIRRIK